MVFVTLQSPVCLKPFVKAVAALSKIGEEAFFEITEEALNLQTANSSTTAIVYFRFDKAFFSEYDSRTATVTRSQADKSIGYSVKLSSKCLNNSLRMISAGLSGSAATGSSNHDESSSKHSSLSVRYDTLSFECVHPNAGGNASMDMTPELPDDELIVRLYSSNIDIGRAKTSTFRLRPLDTSELMGADFAATTLRSSTNHLSAPAKKFSDLLANFATSDRNLLFSLSPTRFAVAADPLGKSGRWHRIGIEVGPASIFTRYDVQEEVNFGCILSELKTFLHYAITLDWSPMLHIDFSEPGRPIVFSVEVTDRLGFASDGASICMGSLVLSTMTLPAGFSIAAQPVKTPKDNKDRNQPPIDQVLRTVDANNKQKKREASRSDENDVIVVDPCPSPTIGSSMEARSRKRQQEETEERTMQNRSLPPQSPAIRSRRGPSIIPAEPDNFDHNAMDQSSVVNETSSRRRTHSPVSFLFTELFNSHGTGHDSLMLSNEPSVLAGDSDVE